MPLSEEDKLWIADRMDGLSGRVDKLTDRVDKLTDRMDDQTERIDGLTEQVQTHTRYILEFRTEAIGRFEAIEQRLDLMTNAVHSIDVRLPGLNKAIADFGATATQVIREQWKAKDLTTDMTDRLARLEEQVSKLIKPAA